VGTDPARADLALVRRRVRVEGIVQGVGYRPFVHALAAEYGLAGFVGNDTAGVFAEVEGAAAGVAEFVNGLTRRAPVLAVVDRVTESPVPPIGEPGFVIVASIQPGTVAGHRRTLVSADTATCADCLHEILDPADRRFGYPFTNCTNCGPRFTIVVSVPYDRAATTMAGFPLCPACAQEYDDPTDRRFHAQPVCCPACGPTLALTDATGNPVGGDPIRSAADRLLAGGVLGVKGLGGYHLAVDASNEVSVAALRARKHREDRPFAVMAADLEAAQLLVDIGPAAPILTGVRRPIVLLPRRTDALLAPSVAPGNRELGVLLPYTPLHHLLARALGRPFVLTSGNVSDEPIAYGDTDATVRLAGIADGFLRHDRPIQTRTDDSVVRLFRGRELPIRRSRGYAPEPLALPWDAPRPVLACGAELKSTFCLLRGRHAFVSHHIGDLENYETFRSYVDGIAHFRRLFDIDPVLVAHDWHPEYLSTKYAAELDGVELVAVQHHHAHIASCLADNGHDGPVLGLALDGLGLGDDGTMWGGELLLADLFGFTRIGHLEPVPMPGGAAAIRQPWRMAASYLRLAYGEEVPVGLDVVRRNAARWAPITALCDSALRTSSAGRLFDAVSALAGVRDAVHYEGQAAVELEQRLDTGERGGYPARIEAGILRSSDLVRGVVDDLLAGAPVERISARFHNGLASALVRLVEDAREATGVSMAALSGGVFQNIALLSGVVDALTARGFEVLVHSRVPPNDGGISLGQAAVAAARDRAGLRVSGPPEPSPRSDSEVTVRNAP